MPKLNSNNVLLVLNILALVVIFGYAAQKYLMPSVAIQAYKSDYKELVFKCDNAMRDHFIAKSQALNSPSEKSIRDLKAAEVGLLTCHEYDVLRKKLIDFGVTENQLARLGLEAIEEKARDVRSFVESHEIRY
jgi:hypothetical protein